MVVAAGCATAGTGGAASGKIVVGETTPPAGSAIEADTVLRVAVDYTVDGFMADRDSIAVILKKHGGGSWEPSRKALTSAEGRIVFELSGADLLKQAELVRPLQLRFVLVSRTGEEKPRVVAGTEALVFGGPRSQPEDDQKAKQLAPHVGKGYLISDVWNDPQLKPILPPSLNQAGNVVWGLFKVCVGNDGDVFAVRTLKSAHRDVDEPWKARIRRWKHKPYTLDGAPVPYCYPVRLEVRSSH
jgi:hypothetical protein